MSNGKHRNALPAGYELHWYKIEHVLGQGGFGLTYLAQDINLERQVAIKEYMPAGISLRESDLSIQPLSKDDEEDYQWGLKRFISEARTLTKFEHPSLVRVFNIFEANKTAYMVMNYETGMSLKEILRAKGTLAEDELARLLLPLMDGLETVHQKGFVHRDIKPGNIFIREDGSPVLLDFGSARQTRGGINSKTLTNFVSPGYAPIEQYASKSDRQGPWTDIYGLGATAYEAMTGNMPEAAIDRSVMISDNAGDNLIKLSMICKGRYSDKFIAAVDHALAFNAQERPQNIDDWRKEFGIDQARFDTIKIPMAKIESVSTDAATVKVAAPHARTRITDEMKEESGEEDTYVKTEHMTSPQPAPTTSKNRWLIISGVTASIIILAAAGFLVLRPVPEKTAISTPAPESTAPVKKKTVVPKVPTQEEIIQKLLAQAQEDFDALRLTTPENNNAYDKYRRILALDRNNPDAKRGIELISDKYTQFVYTNIKSMNLERAAYYLDKAEQISPGVPKVINARNALETAIEEDRKSKTVIGKIKKWFD